MKYLFFILALLGMTACGSSNLNEDTSTASPSVNSAFGKINAHHFSCRNATAEQLQFLIQKVNEQPELKGVIFYFHGGLSGKDYMTSTLGPLLEESIFSSPALNGYYPIFVNYDAHPLKDGNFIEQLKAASKDKAFQRAAQKFYDKVVGDTNSLKAQKGGSAFTSGELTSQVAKNYLNQVSAGLTDKSFKSISVESDEYYYAILQQDVLAAELNMSLVGLDSDFRAIEEDLVAASVAMRGNDQDKGDKALFSVATGAVIAKSLARIALGTNHQLIPTFEEEAFRYYKVGVMSIQKVATTHWNTVKKNAQECFSEGSPGDKLVTSLIESKLAIHTISHSAGSIPTAYLLESMAKKSQKVASVNLIVPAISQEDFKDLYLKYKSSAEHIKGYVLSQKQEEEDSIVWGIYPASLLYAVSGVAEGVWYNDKMLMIEQHLKPTKKVYGKWLHKLITRFDPEPVWRYMAENEKDWLFYPSHQLPYQSENPGKRSSHECTKYPWISSEVASSIVKNISGLSVNSIAQPSSSLTAKTVKELNEKCGFI